MIARDEILMSAIDLLWQLKSFFLQNALQHSDSAWFMQRTDWLAMTAVRLSMVSVNVMKFVKKRTEKLTTLMDIKPYIQSFTSVMRRISDWTVLSDLTMSTKLSNETKWSLYKKYKLISLRTDLILFWYLNVLFAFCTSKYHEKNKQNFLIF